MTAENSIPVSNSAPRRARDAIMSDVTPIRPPSLEASFIRGIRGCVAILENTSYSDEFFVQGTYRRGAPQNKIVRQTLDGILRRGDDKELEGFCALLTEICALTDGDNKRFFSKYADRRERVLRRRYRNKQARRLHAHSHAPSR